MSDIQLYRDARELEASAGFVWLAEVEVPSSPVARIRITSNTDEITFGQSLAGDDNVYSPYPMKVGRITRQNKGDLPQFQVAVARSGVLAEYLHEYDGLNGQEAIVQLVSLGELANYEASLRFQGVVVGNEISDKQISFSIGSLNLTDLPFPRERYTEYTCRYAKDFGGARCGYDLTNVNATYTSCDGSYEACQARGDDEENNMGVERQHPNRFGAFRGMSL